MTERLAQLLRDEAATVDVPSPRPATVLTLGHRIRRRRATGLVAAATVLGVLGVGGALATTASDRADNADNAAPSAADFLRDGGYAVGHTVHFGGLGSEPVSFDAPVKSLFYSAEGLVVRTQRPVTSPADPAAAPSDYTLVTADGEVRSLAVDLGHRVPGTDLNGSRLVYADGAAGDWELVVVDLTNGTETQRIPVTGSFTWAADWGAPPVGLSGDTAYVAMDDATLAIDLATGRTEEAEAIPARTVPVVAGGHAVVRVRSGLEVRDLDTGDPVLTVDAGKDDSGSLSPDGRFLKVMHATGVRSGPDGTRLLTTNPPFEVHELSSGSVTSFDSRASSYGWTPDGHLLDAGRRQVTLCHPTTGTCASESTRPGSGNVRVPGQPFEF